MTSGLRLTSSLPKNFQFPYFPQQINRQNRNMSEVPPALAADSWVDNPNVGNFNPGTKAGQAIIEKKTKGLNEENRLTATQKDAQAIGNLLGNKSPALAKVVTRIPIKYSALGYPTEWGNLLCKIRLYFYEYFATRSS